MMAEEDHPAARYEPDVREAQRRAKRVMLTLGIISLVLVGHAAIILWDTYNLRVFATTHDWDEVIEWSGMPEIFVAVVLGLPLVLATSIVFLRWLHLVVRMTKVLGVPTLRWTPSESVWGFVIPVLSFVRPYYVVRDVNDALAPELVPEPPVKVRPNERGGYRELEILAPPPSRKLPDAFIGGWWAALWAGNLMAYVGIRKAYAHALPAPGFWLPSDVIYIGCAVLAVVMIRAVTARLVERFRRVRYSSAETLEELGVIVG